jgi:hypothetical protein
MRSHFVVAFANGAAVADRNETVTKLLAEPDQTALLQIAACGTA